MDMRKRSDTLTCVLISENKSYIRFGYKKIEEECVYNEFVRLVTKCYSA